MADQITDGLRLIAKEQTVGTEYGPDEHIAWHAAEELESLRRINARLIREMAGMTEILGDDGTGHVPTLVRELVERHRQCQGQAITPEKCPDEGVYGPLGEVE